jgi:hypothetical protein
VQDVLEIAHPESIGPTQQLISTLHAQAPSGTLEKLYVRGDGTVLHARSNVSARFDDSGQLESVTAFIVNESGQVSALQKAEQAEDRLKDALSI